MRVKFVCACMCVRVLSCESASVTVRAWAYVCYLRYLFYFVTKNQTIKPTVNERLKTELHFDMNPFKGFHTYTIQNLSVAI